jgi:hypothetical protein
LDKFACKERLWINFGKNFCHFEKFDLKDRFDAGYKVSVFGDCHRG